MPDESAPSEGERRAFVAKLAEFRNTLRVVEQDMLDALVGAAVTGRTAQELERYWIGPRLDPTDAGIDSQPTAN